MITLSIDFDRVIHDTDNPVPGRRMGGPKPGAIESLHKLTDRGFKLICYSTKANTASGKYAIIDWLEQYKAPEMEVTATKPDADIYVDDKALYHYNWNATMEQIYERLGIEPD